MDLQTLIILGIAGLFSCFFASGFAFELWKKLWLVGSGEVVEIQVRGNARSGVTARISYRYVVGQGLYRGEEEIQLDVAYHEERDTIASLERQYPRGGQIAVYFPRRIPAISSITPGGASIPKLLLAALCVGLGLFALWALEQAKRL